MNKLLIILFLTATIIGSTYAVPTTELLITVTRSTGTPEDTIFKNNNSSVFAKKGTILSISERDTLSEVKLFSGTIFVNRVSGKTDIVTKEATVEVIGEVEVRRDSTKNETQLIIHSGFARLFDVNNKKGETISKGYSIKISENKLNGRSFFNGEKEICSLLDCSQKPLFDCDSCDSCDSCEVEKSKIEDTTNKRILKIHPFLTEDSCTAPFSVKELQQKILSDRQLRDSFTISSSDKIDYNSSRDLTGSDADFLVIDGKITYHLNDKTSWFCTISLFNGKSNKISTKKIVFKESEMGSISPVSNLLIKEISAFILTGEF